MAKKNDKQKIDYSGMDKDKALDMALAHIEKQFGAGSVMRLGGENTSLDVKPIPTGALSLDVALGIGGLPRGRVIEIFGPESSGKTTVALHVAAEVQKRGGIAAFVDAEHALDPSYASNLGVDIDELLVSQPDTGEQALEITEALVRSGALDLVVVDSVAALVPQAEIDGLMGDSHVGLQARLMSQALRKLSGILKKTDTTIIFINQLREKVGVIYGSNEVTTGGRALKFYASVRLDVRREDILKKGTEIYGTRTKIRVVKNKVAPPFKTAEFDIIYGQGISSIGNVIDLAIECSVMTRSGAYYSYNGTRLGQGKDNTREFLMENEAMLSEIEAKVREHYHLPSENDMKFDKNKKVVSLDEPEVEEPTADSDEVANLFEEEFFEIDE